MLGLAGSDSVSASTDQRARPGRVRLDSAVMNSMTGSYSISVLDLMSFNEPPGWVGLLAGRSSMSGLDSISASELSLQRRRPEPANGTPERALVCRAPMGR